MLGVTIRQRRALLVSLHEQAARLEFERDQEGRLGAAAERARIAREMHDIVAHNLTVMIALADGATYAMDSSPERALRGDAARVGDRPPGAAARCAGCWACCARRPSAQPLEPQPSLDRLDELLARVHAAGIPVTMEIDGDPRRAPDGVQLTVFRVAQEALTNTLKHAARPTRAHLALRCRPGSVELEVTDTGENRPGKATERAASRTGSGPWQGPVGAGCAACASAPPPTEACSTPAPARRAAGACTCSCSPTSRPPYR